MGKLKLAYAINKPIFTLAKLILKIEETFRGQYCTDLWPVL
jgi:hypothetical protein